MSNGAVNASSSAFASVGSVPLSHSSPLLTPSPSQSTVHSDCYLDWCHLSYYIICTWISVADLFLKLLSQVWYCDQLHVSPSQSTVLVHLHTVTSATLVITGIVWIRSCCDLICNRLLHLQVHNLLCLVTATVTSSYVPNHQVIVWIRS